MNSPHLEWHLADFMSYQSLTKPSGVVAGDWQDTMNDEERIRPSLLQKALAAKVLALN